MLNVMIILTVAMIFAILVAMSVGSRIDWDSKDDDDEDEWWIRERE